MAKQIFFLVLTSIVVLFVPLTQVTTVQS